MISLLIGLVILGVVLYLIELIPLDGTIKKIIHVLAILFIVLWIIQAVFGVGYFPHFPLR